MFHFENNLSDSTISSSFGVDVIARNLIGGVDYVATALGASNAGGTLADPFVAVFDAAWNLVDLSDDSFALGEDPFLQFSAPSTGTYFFAVGDSSGGTGSYTFTASQSGVPTPISPPPAGSLF